MKREEMIQMFTEAINDGDMVRGRAAAMVEQLRCDGNVLKSSRKGTSDTK